jgi:uncharacterized C2H2 Zn-finger protein
MDLDDIAGPTSEWSLKCRCGKRFFQQNSYTNHINSCSQYRKGVGSTIQAARERYKERRTQSKKGKAVLNSWFADDELDVDTSLPSPSHTCSVASSQVEDNIVSTSVPRRTPTLTLSACRQIPTL